MDTITLPASLSELVRRLDEAVEKQTMTGCCKAVKRVLEDLIQPGADFLPESCLRTHPERYARNLVHRDPQNRYTVIAMIWSPGQGTALHDHAGMWCVECVYQGRILVKSYSLDDEVGEKFRFVHELDVVAAVGEAGALIPPFDYHTIENADTDQVAVTLHVYGGEMDWCNVFVPEDDGLYRLEKRPLSYT